MFEVLIIILIVLLFFLIGLAIPFVFLCGLIMIFKPLLKKLWAILEKLHMHHKHNMCFECGTEDDITIRVRKNLFGKDEHWYRHRKSGWVCRSCFEKEYMK